jgi:chromosome segregation ATPase
MASQQVIEKLEKLQLELETVSKAVKHIDEAAKVAETAGFILKRIPELLAELKLVEEKHRKDLHIDLKGKIDGIEKQLQLLLAELKEEASKLNQVIEHTIQLDRSISDYLQDLKSINFPDRLDKIDNQISSINIGLGNLQTSIQRSNEKIEKGFDETKQNLKSDFDSTKDAIKQANEKITSALKSHLNSMKLEIITQLTDQNTFLKKQARANIIFQIVGLTLVLFLVIYIVIRF